MTRMTGRESTSSPVGRGKIEMGVPIALFDCGKARRAKRMET